MANNFLRSLNGTSRRVYKLQEQLASLKEVNRPSDDPLAISKILDLNNSIKQNDEYKDTISDAIDWTNVQDASLQNATDSVQRIYTLIQQAANGSYNSDDRQAIKSEILQEVETLVDSLNTNFGGKYIFAGKNTTTAPFEVVYDEDGAFQGIAYHGSTGEDENGFLPKEISRGVTVNLRTDGRVLHNEGENGNIGDFISDVITALDNNDTEALGNDLLARADSEMNNIVNYRTEIGAIHNRLQAALERNDAQNLNLKNTLSNTQDVDLAEKFMEYSMEMIAYEASLNMGTRILQTNILNYL
jgi:flagellar hook-associated protein 3 FlgL